MSRHTSADSAPIVSRRRGPGRRGHRRADGAHGDDADEGQAGPDLGAARDDRLCPVERHAEIARLVPGAELVVLDDCAHLSPLEQPDALSAHLLRWLATPRRQPGRSAPGPGR